MKLVQSKPRLIGYACVSTEDQLSDAQLIELQAAGYHTVFEERGSGASRARPVLAKLLRQIDAGEVLVVVIEPAISTSRTDYDADMWRLQAGLDGLLYEAEDESGLIGGIAVHYGQASSDVTSIFGNGSIDTDAYGFGRTLTWLGQSGFMSMDRRQ